MRLCLKASAPTPGVHNAAARAQGDDKKKPMAVKYGLSHVASLVEDGKAQLVVIAHDVDPLELVLWLPALCKRQGVPYCIVKVRASAAAPAQLLPRACAHAAAEARHASLH